MSAPPFYASAVTLAVAAYFSAAIAIWRRLDAPEPVVPGARGPHRWWPLPALLLHGLVLVHVVTKGGSLHFGFAHALSAMFWIAALAVWIESFFLPLDGLLIFVLPLAATTCALPVLFPGEVIGEDTPLLRVHLMVAMLASSLLAVAAMHALMMALFDRVLHGAVPPGGFIARLTARIPPLLVLDVLLFQLLAAGFAALTVTLLSGAVFTEELFGRPLRFDHKTVFAVAAWLIFAGLLTGRAVLGWRGRTALRWTLSGFAMLLLAYVGSSFVLEVVLRRY